VNKQGWEGGLHARTQKSLRGIGEGVGPVNEPEQRKNMRFGTNSFQKSECKHGIRHGKD